ncbi:hypothetical protein MRX96_035737 [Rhipicephalus microplus]
MYAGRGNMAVPAQSDDVVSNGRPADHRTATEAHSAAVAAAQRASSCLDEREVDLCGHFFVCTEDVPAAKRTLDAKEEEQVGGDVNVAVEAKYSIHINGTYAE